jgi:orotidine-5'-phosphate decarboxylase
MRQDPRLVIALDHSNEEEALNFLNQLDPNLCRVKIGSILFTHYGPSLLEKIMRKGFSIFLDLKFHDIPQTVAGACRSSAELGVWMLNVHVSGGLAMMNAAREALQAFPQARRPLLIGVTVLTSLTENDLSAIGFRLSAAETVLNMAHLAKRGGLDGIVCSAQEAGLIRRELGPQFLLVTPGIRLAGDASEDQKRIATPEVALAAGADYLVIGRSFTKSPHPRRLLEALSATVNSSSQTSH